MKRLAIVVIAAAICAVAGPLAAQETGEAYDQNAPITLEGVTDTMSWSMSEGKLVLKPNSGSQLWDIAMPNTKTLLDKGISAEVLSRGSAVTVRGFKAKDTACNPDCKAKATEVTIGKPGKTYSLLGAPGAG